MQFYLCSTLSFSVSHQGSGIRLLISIMQKFTVYPRIVNKIINALYCMIQRRSLIVTIFWYLKVLQKYFKFLKFVAKVINSPISAKLFLQDIIAYDLFQPIMLDEI